MHLRLMTNRVVSETSAGAAASIRRVVVHSSRSLLPAIQQRRGIFGLSMLLVAAGIGIAAIGSPAGAQTPSYTITTDSQQTFPAGSTGFSALGDVPSASLNLLNNATLSFGAGTPSRRMASRKPRPRGAC